jgi:predicted PurR-regulated permease PerM
LGGCALRGKWNKEDIKKGAIFTVSLCLVMLFSHLIGKISVIGDIFGTLLSATTPILMGCIIAFLLCPIMNYFKKHITVLLNKILGKEREVAALKVGNVLAVFFTMLVFILCIVGLLWILIPELRDSIIKLYGSLPSYIDNVHDMINEIPINPRLEDVMTNSLTDFESVLNKIVNEKLIPNMDNIIIAISSGVMVSIRFVLNFLISIIIAIYILSSKERLAAQCKKLIYSIFSKNHGNRILDGLDYVNSVFGGFINGKIVDSIIIGFICAIFCESVDMPYAVLISVVVGVTNIIPFFGPFIGAIPSALLVLVENPKMCLMFVIFIIILQQVDGNIIGPLILGDSTGLSGLWIMVAIIVGGNLFGFTGMLLGVPVFACIYALISVVIKNKLKSKGLNEDTEYYLTLRKFDEETGEAVRGPKPKRVSAKQRKKQRRRLESIQNATKNVMHRFERNESENKKENSSESTKKED